MTPELLALLSLTIPDNQLQSAGFLEIAGAAHHENINSRIYAHFLNSDHIGVRSSFLSALLELIEERTKKRMNLQRCSAVLEETTNKGFRIDILLRDHENQSAIIIENKIYHLLNNDLANYWDHVKYDDENKVGVLLTLEAHAIPDTVAGKFINITHNEWIGRIRQNGLPMGIPPNYYQYINDFANTMDRLTKSYAMNEQTRFYFQHASKVIQAKNTMDEAYRFMEDQLDILCAKLGWQKYGSSWNWRNIWDAHNELDTYITVCYDTLLKGELKFLIIIELMRKDKEQMYELEEILKDSKQYKQMKRGESKKNYVHFGLREYTITLAELEDFGNHVYQLVLRDFSETILAIIQHYYPDTDISKWISNFDTSIIQND